MELCKICLYPPATMPPVERKNNDQIWICPLCGNEGLPAFWKGNKPMTEVLETK